MTAHTTADRAQDLLDAVERLKGDIEQQSLLLPPSEVRMRRWAMRLASMREDIGTLKREWKAKVQAKLFELEQLIETTRYARDRFIAAPIATPNDDWSSAPSLPRHALADAIHAEVQRPSNWRRASAAAPAKALDPQPPTREPTPVPVYQYSAEAEPPAAIHDAAAVTPEMRRELPPDRSLRHDFIMALEARLARPNSFEEARRASLAWLRRKRVPIPAAGHDNFESPTSAAGHRCVAVGIDGVWALQLDTVDHQTPGRRWIVELVLVDASPTPAVGVTLTAVSPAHLPRPDPSVPALLTALIDTVGLLDVEAGQPLSANASVIEHEANVERLVRELQQPKRRQPVIVISRYQKDDAERTFMDPDGLALRLRGLARVFVLDRKLTWVFNSAVGKRFAVAGASVRMYMPGFTPDDAAELHPFWNPAVLAERGWTLKQLAMEFLRTAAGLSLAILEREDAPPAFARVREALLRRQLDLAIRAAEEARLDAATAPRVDPVLAEQLAALERELRYERELRLLMEDELQTEKIRSSEIRETLIRQRDQAIDERDRLRGSNRHLEERLRALAADRTRNAEDVEPEFPDVWDDLEEWCERYTPGRVVLTQKAIRAARASKYEEIPFAYRVLWFLSRYYVSSKRNEGVNLAALEEASAELGVDVALVGRGALERKSKDTYSVPYRGKTLPLDMHVRGNSDRDPRYGFRLYFHWHAEEQCVIVGSFPAHLDNSLS